MMKKLTTLLAAVLALAALAGCGNTEQETPEAASLKTVRFRAGAADTRTAFAEPVDGVYRTLWTENDSDVLLSLNYGKAVPSAISPSADGATASFEASFDPSAATAPYTFYAVSPASAARAISPSRRAWSVCIAAAQKPLATSVDEAAQLLVAKSAASATLPEEVDLHFSHLTAYGRITLKNLALGDASVLKAELTFSTPVVGEFYWGEDGTLTDNGGSHTITLDTDASGDLWFACAPVDVSGATMSLALFTDHGVMTKEIVFPEGRSFASGKVARFSVDMAGIEMQSNSFVFTLVTAADQLAEGCDVVFLSEDGKYAMGAQEASKNYREGVSSGFSLSGNEVAVSNRDVAVFTLEKGTSPETWSFKGVDGYLAAQDKNSNYLVTKAEKDGYASWTLSFQEDGSLIPEAVAGARRVLRFCQTANYFTCYKSTSYKAVKLYRKASSLPVADDPLSGVSEYGCYLSGAERVYVPGSDQIHRSYDADGKLVFALLNAAEKEQLVISGYDPSLVKGDEVTVTVSWRKHLDIRVKDETFRVKVIREDGSKVWLGDGTGQGFIIKK
jgi:hypothetical protein